MFDSFRHKLPPTVPPGGMSVVDARDVATGMLHMVQGGRSGERYILSGGYVEFGEIIANLALLTGTRRPKTKMPFAAALQWLLLRKPGLGSQGKRAQCQSKGFVCCMLV